MPVSLRTLALLAAFATPLLADSEPDPDPLAPPPASGFKLNALLQLDFSNYYITPRGLNVENRGLIFQPLLLVFADLYSSETSVLDGISLTAGVWNSIHSEESGADPGHWNEIDPILGLTFRFADQFRFDVTYTAFDSQTDSYPTSHHIEFKLGVDDSKWLGAFALNPYIAYWQELSNKATVVFDPATSEESYYFTLGINPSVKCGVFKLEFPTFVNIVGTEFYQQFDGSPGGSGLAVFQTGVKASVPLTSIPSNLGSWTWYIGLRYYHLDNDGLEDGNLVLTADGADDDLLQFYTGISVFF